MKSLSSLLSAEDKQSFLTDRPLQMERVIQRVMNKKYGAVISFSGNIRGTEKGLGIKAIRYEAYPVMAEKEVAKIILEAEIRWRVFVSLQHRIGVVPVGESSLVVACAGVHRREAFMACQFVVNEIKKNVPIWKVGFDPL